MNAITLCSFGENSEKEKCDLNNYGYLRLFSVCLGCKGSWVQIPPVRPTYLSIITKENIKFWGLQAWSCFASFCSVLSCFGSFIRRKFGEIILGARGGNNMKWFKHFTDNHRGRSIQDLLDRMGHSGLCYYLLVEMCAEKLEKKGDEMLTEADCQFHFHTRIVKQNLRLTTEKLKRLLSGCDANGLLSFQFDGSFLQINMPILLNLLNRDEFLARKIRAEHATKTRLDIDKNKNKNIHSDWLEAGFATLVAKYKKNFPGTDTGPFAKVRLAQQAKSADDLQLVMIAIDHYREYLNTESWRKPKTSFSNFLGTEKSGYFWRDYVTRKVVPINSTVNGFADV